MLWNLLSNALKFTPGGGRVQVVTEADERYVSIRFIDDGEGIDPEFLPHLFERFRQGDASSSRRHQGLGLGLAIVKEFAELHGGKISATSDGPGHGATFVLQLPRSEGVRSFAVTAKREIGATSATEEFALTGVSVLVLDDQWGCADAGQGDS
jgi:signal transduction histidine kinase